MPHELKKYMYFNPQPKPVSKKKKTRHYIKPGVKTNDWETAKRLLKVAFEEVNITYCEIGLYLQAIPEHAERMAKHSHKFFLTWAHGDKRNNLEGAELITLVVLGCVDCHNYIERMPRLEMRAIVEAIIEARAVQPSTINYKYDN